MRFPRRFPPRCRRPPPRCRRKIMKILTHARTTHYPDISQGLGICTSYIIVAVVDNGCECFEESRAAFNARFFGRLLSKQTFRRCEGPRFFFHRMKAHVRFIRLRVTILRAIERRVRRLRFSGPRPSTNIPLVLDTCVNKSRDNLSHLARSSHMRFENIHDQMTT